VTNLRGKTIFITGGSRGIGRAIALKAAADGANVVIAAKTNEPHPKLPGTIQTVAREIEAIGGKALPLQLDVRRDDDIRVAVAKATEAFGGIDILVNHGQSAFHSRASLRWSARSASNVSRRA
jgi:citronellol/citronellal dehydrogenase